MGKPENDSNWVNISNLDNGEDYEMRIVAVNGADDEARSPIKTIRIGQKHGK